MDPKPSNAESENVQIERERQKTKRQMMFYILMGVIACIGLFLVFRGTDGTRKVDIDLSKGKFAFSVDIPILEQVKQTKDSTTVRGEKIDFTTGTVNAEVIEEIKKDNIPVTPNRFTGKNLINEEAGYLLTVGYPENYSVSHNRDGLANPLIPINTITASYGNVNITRWMASAGYDFATEVEATLNMLLSTGYIAQIPHISYDASGTTAFLTYTNQQTGGVSYQKIISKNGMMYAATANYNAVLTPQKEKDDMINMVASFTLIDS